MHVGDGNNALLPAKTEGSHGGGASRKWTVADSGKCVAPTSDDYAQWTIQQLRRECAARNKAIKRSIDNEKAVRVAALQESDCEVVVVAVPQPKAERVAVRPSAAVISDAMAGSMAIDINDRFFPKLGSTERTPRRLLFETGAIGRGVMPVAVQADSTKPEAKAPMVAKPQSKRSAAREEQDDLRATLKQITGYLTHRMEATTAAPAKTSVSRVSAVLKCLSKPYGVLQQVAATVEELKRHGHANAAMQQSLALHRAGIEKFEREYADCLGIAFPAYPAKRARVDGEAGYRG